jgi:hypothetical protein
MSVYQCNNPVQLRLGYEQYNLLEGQLINTIGNQQLEQYFKNHPNFYLVLDEGLCRIAPPIHLVKQPDDPYRMRKEDIIDELRGYGIQVDIYDFSQKLSMQLSIARKMKKRNFITILNPRGVPVYIDSVNLPVPAVSKIDETLSEPEEPNYDEFFAAENNEEKTKQFKEEFSEFEVEEIVKEAKRKDSVMEIEPIIDKNEINKGKTFEEFMLEHVEKPYEVPVEMERIIKPIKIEEVEPEETFEYEGKQQFLYLIETQDRNFMCEDVDEALLDEFKTVKWSKINIDVIENYLRYSGIDVDYEENDMDVKLRWKLIGQVRDIYDNASKVEKEKIAHEINFLQKRHEEISLIEPSYRDFKEITIKRRITDLGKYGMNVSYDKNTNVRKYARKVFTLAKLGLQVPENDEDIDKKLTLHKRAKAIK